MRPTGARLGLCLCLSREMNGFRPINPIAFFKRFERQVTPLLGGDLPFLHVCLGLPPKSFHSLGWTCPLCGMTRGVPCGVKFILLQVFFRCSNSVTSPFLFLTHGSR